MITTDDDTTLARAWRWSSVRVAAAAAGSSAVVAGLGAAAAVATGSDGTTAAMAFAVGALVGSLGGAGGAAACLAWRGEVAGSARTSRVVAAVASQASVVAAWLVAFVALTALDPWTSLAEVLASAARPLIVWSLGAVLVIGITTIGGFATASGGGPALGTSRWRVASSDLPVLAALLAPLPVLAGPFVAVRVAFAVEPIVSTDGLVATIASIVAVVGGVLAAIVGLAVGGVAAATRPATGPRWPWVWRGALGMLPLVLASLLTLTSMPSSGVVAGVVVQAVTGALVAGAFLALAMLQTRRRRAFVDTPPTVHGGVARARHADGSPGRA